MLPRAVPDHPQTDDVQVEKEGHPAVETADRGIARLWRVLTRRMMRLVAIVSA